MSNTNDKPTTIRVSRKKQAVPKKSVIQNPSIKKQELTKGRYVVLETCEDLIHKDTPVKMIKEFIQSNSEHLDKISCGILQEPFLLSKFYFQVCVKRTLEIIDGTGMVICDLRDHSELDNLWAAHWATCFKMGNMDLMTKSLLEQVQFLPTFTSMFVCEEIPKSSRYGHAFIYDYIEKTVVHLKIHKQPSE